MNKECHSSAGRETGAAFLTASTVILAVAVLLLFKGVFAASVQSVEVDEMLQASKLVIEGVVIEVESRSEAADPWNIHTYVTFKVIDIIKGSTDSEFITLSFLGGTVGDRTLDIGGLQVPRQGEHGIYFIEEPARVQVNPLYGWQQGHFLSQKDTNGVERITTSGNRPVYGIDLQPSPVSMGLSDGVARGLVVQKAAAKRQQALSIEEFKSALKGMLGKQQ